jgi:hypothetical protein
MFSRFRHQPRQLAGAPAGKGGEFVHDQLALRAVKITPTQSKEAWQDAGYSDGDRTRFEQAGLTLQIAGQWRGSGFDVTETINWYGARFTPAEAEQWRSSGFERRQGVVNRAQEAKILRDAGLGIEDACRWTEAVGADSITYVDTNNAETASSVALAWRNGAGCSLEETKALFSARFSPDDAVIMRRNGISVEEACEWKTKCSCASATEIIRWKKCEFLPDEAAKWGNVLIANSPEATAKLRDAGLSPGDVGRYIASGARTVNDVILTIGKNPYDKASPPMLAKRSRKAPEHRHYGSGE